MRYFQRKTYHMDEHYLNEQELATIKQQMDALENRKEALRQRILQHFKSPRAMRERMIKNGFMEEDGSFSMRFAAPGRWRTLEEYWNRHK